MVKLGKRGKFIACTGFKDGCKYTRPLDQDGEPAEAAEPVFSEEKCDKCQAPMLIKDGRYGKYLACSAYPACKNIQPLNKPKGTGVACPDCKEGELIEKKSRFGKIFYSCNRYPQVQVRPVGSAGGRALPQVRPPGDGEQDHQARRHLSAAARRTAAAGARCPPRRINRRPSAKPKTRQEDQSVGATHASPLHPDTSHPRGTARCAPACFEGAR